MWCVVCVVVVVCVLLLSVHNTLLCTIHTLADEVVYREAIAESTGNVPTAEQFGTHAYRCGCVVWSGVV
jgi:hypothetical protein